MEPHTQALEIVCRHYKAEYESIHTKSLRIRLNRAYKKTSAAKKEAHRARVLAKHLYDSHQDIMVSIRDILVDLLESCVVGEVWISCVDGANLILHVHTRFLAGSFHMGFSRLPRIDWRGFYNKRTWLFYNTRTPPILYCMHATNPPGVRFYMR